MKRLTHKAFAVGIVSFVAFAVPFSASAQAVTKTIQVLPPGGVGCQALPVTSVVPHVQEGELHSFDITVQDPSYVAVLAEVGSEAIPFRYMTRFNHGGGFIRHHIDINAARITNPLSVSLTLLSSPVGSPTCLSIISFSVSQDGQVLAPGTTSVGSPTVTVTSHTVDTTAPRGTGAVPGKTPVATDTATSTDSSPILKGAITRIKGLCDGNGTLQLWLLLLAVYIVIAALTALAKPPLAQKSVVLPLSLILVPLVLLLAFWLFAPSCRAEGWIPAVSIMVAIIALLVAFREQNPGLKIISLPPAKPSTNTPAISKSTSPVPVETKGVQQKGK
ncbi:MAG: hypothetical protein ACYCZ0_03105 [Minisyncoccota bacterium]